MSRPATLLLVGAGVLVVLAPTVGASPLGRPGPTSQLPVVPGSPDGPHDGLGPAGARAAEQVAAGLLGAAVTAGRALAYSGTAHHSSWRGGRTSSATVALRHVPGLGLDVQPQPTAGTDPDEVVRALQADVLDETGVELLMRHYALSVAREGGCAGREAAVVEAVRDRVSMASGGSEPTAEPQVAGRFWVDRDSGLLLRREVYDEAGRVVRSTAFLDVQVAQGRQAVRTVSTTPGDRVVDLADEWPRELPGGFVLLEARERRADGVDGRATDVLHLAYSDGLSSLSLFAQPGLLDGPPGEGFQQEQVADADVWVRGTTPERVVWSGDDRTWTLLSDAPAGAVRDVVAVLPHQPVAEGGGVLARLSRGAARVGSWLNPFG